MKQRVHSLPLVLLVCLCCYWVAASAQQQGNILTGIVRGDFGYFDFPNSNAVSFRSIIFPNTTVFPPERKLVTFGRYGSSKAVFLGGELWGDRLKPRLNILLDRDGELEHLQVNVSLPEDDCGIWLLTANRLNSKVYAFTQPLKKPEFNLYEVYAETGATKLLGTYKHDLPCDTCWVLNGGVSMDPFREEVLVYASSNKNLALWETWRISVRDGKLLANRKIAQRMDAPALSRDMTTFYSSSHDGTVFQAIDATTGQVIRSKNSTIHWTVQKNVAALDDEKGLYFACASLFGGQAHLLVFDINSLELKSSPYTPFRWYQALWDLLWIPETF